MQDRTIQMIELALGGDDTLSADERQAILAACRNPLAPAYRPEQSVPPLDRWLSPRETAGLLSVTLRTVQRWIQSGRLPSRRILGRRRIPASALANLPEEGDEDIGGGPSRKPTPGTGFVQSGPMAMEA